MHTTVTRLVRGCHTAVTHRRGCQGRPGAGRGGRRCPAPGRPRRARQQQEGPGRAAMAGEEREGREGAGEGAGASAGRCTGWGAPPLAAQPRAGLCWVMLGCAGLYWVVLGALFLPRFCPVPLRAALLLGCAFVYLPPRDRSPALSGPKNLRSRGRAAPGFNLIPRAKTSS